MEFIKQHDMSPIQQNCNDTLELLTVIREQMENCITFGDDDHDIMENVMANAIELFSIVMNK